MKKQNKVALIVPFLKLFGRITKGDPEKEYLFNAGSWDGQAQKIYLGACPAAMFRLPLNKLLSGMKLAKIIAKNYGLNAFNVNNEIWIIQPKYKKYLKIMMTLPENSAGWHLLRAILCGIPLDNVDVEYHLRKGFGSFAEKHG
ncbi:MAG: hypothetical protein WC797_02965 [Candidatus Paceibacterota bacterium]|jgi:hypothetical protein